MRPARGQPCGRGTVAGVVGCVQFALVTLEAPRVAGMHMYETGLAGFS